MPGNVPFVDRLPHPDARAAFVAWRTARRRSADQTPHLTSFAPHELPRSVMPLAFVYELRADGELHCVLAGEEVRFLFGYNPKGKTLREMVPGGLGDERANQVLRAMRAGLPFWMEGGVLIDGRTHLVMGRLILPVRRGDPAADGVLIIFFRLGEFDSPIITPIEPVSFNADPLVWCTQPDLT